MIFTSIPKVPENHKEIRIKISKPTGDIQYFYIFVSKNQYEEKLHLSVTRHSLFLHPVYTICVSKNRTKKDTSRPNRTSSPLPGIYPNPVTL